MIPTRKFIAIRTSATCKGNSIEASGDAWGAFAVRIFPSASSVVIELVTDGG